MAKIFIGVPIHGGSVSAPTANSIVSAASGLQHEIQFQIVGLSLLARGFNTLFCSAYKRDFDYFILLHSDIGVYSNIPGTSWADILVNRLRQLEMASVSVVSPIKNEQGVTSTALQLHKNNPYGMRRITVKELEKLPPQCILKEDVCKLFNVPQEEAGPLLINTGVLCMDLKNVDWFGLRWPGFHIEDCIAWNKQGVPDPYTTPEDWNLSRWLDRKKLSYCAISDLQINHLGSKSFTNFGNWGWDTDTNPVIMPIKEYENG